MMKEGLMKSWISFLMVVLLLGCAAGPGKTPDPKMTPAALEAAAGPFPEQYELRIISWLRMNSDDPDNVQILSIGPPQLKVLEVSAIDRGLMKGDAVWESITVVQAKSPPSSPAYRHFLFKDGVIRAVDLK
jgi:hypothetical protein